MFDDDFPKVSNKTCFGILIGGPWYEQADKKIWDRNFLKTKTLNQNVCDVKREVCLTLWTVWTGHEQY